MTGLRNREAGSGATGRPAVLATILRRFRNLTQRLEEVLRTERTILAVTPNSSERAALTLFSLEQCWHTRYCNTFESALELRQQHSFAVILYDRDLPGVKWETAATALLEFQEPACFILLSDSIDGKLWRDVLDCGGYDVTRKPLNRDDLVRLINGACHLASSIDCVEI